MFMKIPCRSGGTVVMEILTAAIIIELLVLCTGVVSLENNLSQSPVMVFMHA